MSGARLCRLLCELGYQEDSKGGGGVLDPDSLEWPFQYDEARPILDWLCSSLRPSNVLSPSELSQYEQFLQEGKMLEGEDLDFAYESISAFSTRRDNQEAVFGAEEGVKDIRDATSALKAEALDLQRQLKHLQSQYDMLSGQASTLIQGRRARVAATSTVNGQLTNIDDSLSARNLEMNAVLGRIASTTQELSHYHSGEVFFAMYATLASPDVDLCLIPESPFYLEGEGGLFEYVEKRLKEDGHMVIVIAEGAGQDLLDKDLSLGNEKDASGNKLLADNGLRISQKIKAPNATNSLCGYKIVTGQPSDKLGEDSTELFKDF